MPGHPRPLAVGLLRCPVNATQSERTRARIELALRAAAEGYALVETYEVGHNGVSEDAAFQGLEDLASRLDAEAVVCSGSVDVARVDEVADRVRMIVRHCG